MTSTFNLPDLIAERASVTPDAICLQEVGGAARTYKDVRDGSAMWARALLQLGIKPGETILTAMPTSASTVEVWCGISLARAIEVSVNPDLRGALLQHVLSDSAARIAIVHASVLAPLLELLVQSSVLEHIVVVGSDDDSSLHGPKLVSWETLAARSETEAEQPALGPVADHDIACLLYTSGTTGASKGVMVPWAQLDEAATGIMLPSDVESTDAAYVPFPPFHITLRSLLICMVRAGGRTVVRDRFSTSEFWNDVDTYGCTVTLLVGAMVNFVHRHPDQPPTTPLEKVIMIPVMADVEDFKARYGVKVKPLFGMTEISAPITSLDWDVSDPKSCGRLRPGHQARIVDENDIEVPDGQAGELVIRSDRPWALAAGYWRNAEATTKAWRNLWFHTGDLMSRDAAGNFFHIDRLKDSIRRRGENISSAEVEDGILGHPDVLECAVVGVASRWSEEEVMAFIVARQGRSVDLDQLHEFLQDRLAPFMQPEYVELVDSLPKTPTEKTRKVELRERGVGPTTWHHPRTKAMLERSSASEAGGKN